MIPRRRTVEHIEEHLRSIGTPEVFIECHVTQLRLARAKRRQARAEWERQEWVKSDDRARVTAQSVQSN